MTQDEQSWKYVRDRGKELALPRMFKNTVREAFRKLFRLDKQNKQLKKRIKQLEEEKELLYNCTNPIKSDI